MIKKIYNLKLKQGGAIEGSTFLGSLKQGDNFVNTLKVNILDNEKNSMMLSTEYVLYLHIKRADSKRAYLPLKRNVGGICYEAELPNYLTSVPGKLECNIEVRSIKTANSDEETITIIDGDASEDSVNDVYYIGFSDMFSFNVERSSNAKTEVDYYEPDALTEIETRLDENIQALQEEIDSKLEKQAFEEFENKIIGNDNLIKDELLPHMLAVNIDDDDFVNPGFNEISNYDSIVIENKVYQLVENDSHNLQLSFANIDINNNIIDVIIINDDNAYEMKKSIFIDNKEFEEYLNNLKMPVISFDTVWTEELIRKVAKVGQVIIGESVYTVSEFFSDEPSISLYYVEDDYISYHAYIHVGDIFEAVENAYASAEHVEYIKDTLDAKIDATKNSVESDIARVESIAKGAQKALSFENYEDMIEVFNTLDSEFCNVGQSIYIVTLQVPDLWVYNNEVSGEEYEYTTDDDFVNELKTNGYVHIGHYLVAALENGKVDLSNYPTIQWVNTMLTTKQDIIDNLEVQLYQEWIHDNYSLLQNYNSIIIDGKRFIKLGNIQHLTFELYEIKNNNAEVYEFKEDGSYEYYTYVVTDKEYVDDNINDLKNDKLDKFTASGERIRIYGVDKDGVQTMYYADYAAGNWTIPLRGEGGVIRVGNPQIPGDAATKYYVDNNLATTNQNVTTNAENIEINAEKISKTQYELNELKASLYGYVFDIEDYTFENLDNRAIPNLINNKNIAPNTRAMVKKIKGKSIINNQLVYNGNFSTASGENDGWYNEDNADHAKHEFEDNICTITATEGRLICRLLGNKKSNQVKNVIGHKYLVTIDYNATFTGDEVNEFNIITGGQITYFNIENDSKWHSKAKIYTATSSIAQKSITTKYDLNLGDTIKLANFQCFDLSEIFGIGNEPTDIEDARLTEYISSYHQYDTGSVKSVTISGIKINSNNRKFDGATSGCGKQDVFKSIFIDDTSILSMNNSSFAKVSEANVGKLIPVIAQHKYFFLWNVTDIDNENLTPSFILWDRTEDDNIESIAAIQSGDFYYNTYRFSKTMNINNSFILEKNVSSSLFKIIKPQYAIFVDLTELGLDTMSPDKVFNLLTRNGTDLRLVKQLAAGETLDIDSSDVITFPKTTLRGIIGGQLTNLQWVGDELVVEKNQDNDYYSLKKITRVFEIEDISSLTWILSSAGYWYSPYFNTKPYPYVTAYSYKSYIMVPGYATTSADGIENTAKNMTVSFTCNKSNIGIYNSAITTLAELQDELQGKSLYYIRLTADIDNSYNTKPSSELVVDVLYDHLTKEQVTALVKKDYEVEVVDNDNVDFIRPDVAMTFVVKNVEDINNE